MTRYVALLRGVNVGGITIKMADLRAALEGAGFSGVRTVLASGNVLFDADETDRKALKQRFETCLRDTFGYDAWIVLTDIAALGSVVDAYPFDPEREGWHPYVVFSSDVAVLEEAAQLQDDLDPALERIALGDGVLFWEVERGHSLDSAFAKHNSKARLKPHVTTRNLRTLVKLLV